MREKLIALVRSQGFDLFSACELADKIIAETQASAKPQTQWSVGKLQFILKKRV